MENHELFSAAKNGNIDLLERCLQKGTCVNATDTTEGFEGFTALHWAIQYRQVEAVQYLLKAGANPDHKSQNDTSPLCRAVYTHCVQEGSGEATRQIILLLKNALIQRHKNDPQALIDAITYENIDGFTPRYLAAYHSNSITKELEDAFLNAKAALLSKKKDIPLEEARQQVALDKKLFYAVGMSKHKDVVKALTEGANPNGYRDAYNWSLLHYAVAIPNAAPMTDILLWAGADPDAQIDFKHKPVEALQDVPAWYNKDAVQYNRSVLFLAVHRQREDDVSSVVAALQKKYAFNTPQLISALSNRESNGNTPLEEAERLGNASIASMLGAALNNAYTKLEKENELFEAIADKNVRYICDLLRWGDISATCRNFDGKQACALLAHLDDADILQALFDNIARTYSEQAEDAVQLLQEIAPEIQDDRYSIWEEALFQSNQLALEQNNLWVDIHAGNYEKVRSYLAAGKPLPVKPDGKTPLFYAVEQGQKTIVELLLEEGCSADTSDRSRKSAITVAIEKGYCRIAELLLDALERQYPYKGQPGALLQILKQADVRDLSSPLSASLAESTAPNIAEKVKKLAEQGNVYHVIPPQDMGTLKQVLADNASRLRASGNKVYSAMHNPKILADTQKALDALGIRRLPYKISIGGFSIVCLMEEQVIRLSKKSTREGKRIDTPEILQPIYSADLEHDLHIEILPRVNTKNVDMDDCKALQIALAKKDYYFYDAKPSNIGKLPDGTPVVIDAGAVVTRDELTRMDHSERTNMTGVAKRVHRAFGGSATEMLPYFESLKSADTPSGQWENMQEKWFGSKMDLHHLISDQELADSGNTPLAKLVEKYGLSKRQLAHYIMNAMEQSNEDVELNTSPVPFMQRIHQEAINASDTLPARHNLPAPVLEWANRVLPQTERSLTRFR